MYLKKNKQQAIRYWKIQGCGERILRMPCLNLKTLCVMHTYMFDHIDYGIFFLYILFILLLFWSWKGPFCILVLTFLVS